MRGKGALCHAPLDLDGITPACAGKSGRWCCPCLCDRDHPRVCGEKKKPLACDILGVGSPPRVRGKAPKNWPSMWHTGITPACAGKSGHGHRRSRGRRDHPRVCGEKQMPPTCREPTLGSPPRVRGKDLSSTIKRRRSGITPACAGKRYTPFSLMLAARDHPRVCGEKSGSKHLKNLLLGSPPRVRGKACFFGRLRPGDGITPACAGKRCILPRMRMCSRDHPRVCGEKILPSRVCAKILGSPPRVRGKVQAIFPPPQRPGITPACAGKSIMQQRFPVCRRDHPRVCGEKSFISLCSYQLWGSPPRVRGKAYFPF